MIELPDMPGPNGIEFRLIDKGYILGGASSLRVGRPGSRWGAMVSYPPMRMDVSRKFIARLNRAKREGLRIEIPLVDVPQGIPGAPVVDGAGQAGAALNVRGLTPAYIAKEGFWLTIKEADGTEYLHQMAQTAVADGSGNATLQIEPPLRAPFADGDAIEMAKPTMSGFVEGDEWGWQINVNRLIALQFPIEEYK